MDTKQIGETMYYRLCESLDDYGTLIPTKENIFKYITDSNKDYYISTYKYNQSHYEYFQKERTVSGITDVKTDQLFFDFDSSNIQEAQTDAQKIVEKLYNEGIEEQYIKVYFSGNKGFHVIVDSTDYYTPEELKTAAVSLAKDLKTFDSRVYNSNRILRVVNTRHPKTGLFKIQLTIDDLFDLTTDQIKSKAKLPSKVFTTEATQLPQRLFKVSKTLVKHDLKPNKTIAELDLSKKPKFLSDWKYALSQGFFVEGTQNDTIMILASTYKFNNFDQETAYHMIKAACEKQSNRFNKPKIAKEDIWNRISHVYSDHWQGGTYSEDNFPTKLQNYLEELGIPRKTEKAQLELQTVNEIYNTFSSYAENIEQNTIKTGIPGLDDKCRITTSMLVGLLGSPGVGKSSAVLNMLNHMSLGGEDSIFFSLDMGKPLIYQKLAQRFTGMSGEEVFSIFVNKDEEKKEFIRKKIEENYANVKMCFKTGATVDDMRRYILQQQENTGKKVRLIVVDYLEKVLGPYSDPTVNAGAIAKQLQELSNDLDICVIVLLQPQKMAGTPADPITSYRQIKGASVIEQDCRVVISIWRDGFDAENTDMDKFITFAILKNTMGSMGKIDCGWEGKTGKIYKLEDVQRMELEDLRQYKKELKNAKDNDF